jgi:hypothetical protein
MLSTAWALLTLEKAVPTFEIAVAVDVKPGSCRNPFNVGQKGRTPVAVLGSEEFDVLQLGEVDILGVAPIRVSYEDVATPYEPFLGKEDAFDCTTDGPDGYMDMMLHFDSAELAAAIEAEFGPLADGDVIVLPLTGVLAEEYGGTAIVGEDVIVILKKK